MANTVFANEVIGSKIKDILTTSVDLKNFMTIDATLTEAPGMKKKVNTYVATGEVEDLAIGAGNSKEIEASFTSKDYDVLTTQGKFQYFDEQAMTDPNIVDVGVEGLTKTITNDFTKKAIAEYGKATLTQAMGTNGIDFDTIVDAIAKLDTESEAGYFLLINPAEKAELRKNLKELLSYSEGFARTGYIGTVAGIPVYVSKAVPAKTAFLANPQAVTLFLKKDVEVEQDRDADKRNNIVYGRVYEVVALTDETKVVKIGAGA